RVSACRHALALADAHLRHQLNELAALRVGARERLAQQLDLFGCFIGGDRESIRRLLRATRDSAAPGAVDQLTAYEIRSFAGLKNFGGRRRNAARVRLLLVERARDDIRNEFLERGGGVADGIRDPQSRVVRALLIGALRELVKRVVND